jgi:hypothetical protein
MWSSFLLVHSIRCLLFRPGSRLDPDSIRSVDPEWRHRGKGIAIFDKTNVIFFNFKFFLFLVIKTLDPDWIRIQPKTLDPDLESKNLDPKYFSLAVDSHHLYEDPYPHKKAVDGAFLLAAGLDLNEDCQKITNTCIVPIFPFPQV